MGDSPIKIGQLVRSRAGRDSDRWFIVVSLCEDERFVFVADGRLRGTCRPKKKNIKHLEAANVVFEDIAMQVEAGRPISDSTIKELISRLTSPEEVGTVDGEGRRN